MASSQLRRQQHRNAIFKQTVALLAASVETTAQGVVARDNGDGTVQVNISGDPTAVTAFTHASYTPTPGEQVFVRLKGNHAVVQDAKGTQSTVNAKTVAASSSSGSGSGTVYSCQASCSSSVTLTAGQYSIVPFDTIDDDPESMFATGSHTATAVAAGLYLVCAQVAFTSPAANMQIYAGLYKNATAPAADQINGYRVNAGDTTGAAAFAGITLQRVLRLAVGDTIGVSTYGLSGSTGVATSAANCFFSMTQVG